MSPLAAARAALAETDLAKRVEESLGRAPARARIVAIGKAAPAMTRGALARWPNAEALVVVPDGIDTKGLNAEILHASHPLPDRRSVRAAERCLAFVAEEPCTVLVLVSGGASALVCAPIDGVSLAQKRAVTQAMLRSGATIQELNVARRHLSRIKGGGLARAAARSRVLVRIASDVIGGTSADVGSGPASSDPSSVSEARRLLRRHSPEHAKLPLARTLAPKNVTSTKIVASPEELARLVAKTLRGARVVPPSQASVDDLAAEYLRLAKRLRPGHALVRAAEPSLVVTKKGKGGRCTHLAALVGRDLPPGVTFLALATDGVDGSSGTSGALVRSGFAEKSAIDGALARFATGPLHARAGTAIPSMPTGHNLTDLHVLAH